MPLQFQEQPSVAPKKSIPRVALVTQRIAPEGQVATQASPSGVLLSQATQNAPLEAGAQPLSPGQRLVLSFQKLASANRLLSDEIAIWHESIRVLNEALSKIKLGVSGWHKLSSGGGGQYDPTGYWSRELGWSQHDGKWQICLRKVWGDYQNPDDESEEVWPFEAAPRWLQLDAGPKLPDMVDVLIQRTEEMTKRVSKRKTEAFAMIADLQTQLVDQERA